MSKLRILLADDHVVLRQGLRLLIEAQPDMEVAGEADDGRMAIQRAMETRPDVVVMDVSMPRMDGREATLELKRLLPQSKVLALTRYKEGGYLQLLLRAGAEGYVLKQNSAEELISAIRAVAVGGKYIDPAVAEKVVSGYVGRLTSRNTASGELSEREGEVLRLIARGYSNKEIAGRFELSVKTIEAHKANAMKKLSLRGRVDIIRYALLQGWLEV